MKIIFICIGNTCRSVMAEYIAKQVLPSEFHIESAGFEATGMPYQKFALDVINDFYNKNIQSSPSKNISEFDLTNFDKIYVLDYGVWKKLKNNESIKHKLNCFHIDDPFETNKSVYLDTFDKINTLIKSIGMQEHWIL